MGDQDPHLVWLTAKGKEILVARSGGVINFPLEMADRRAGRLIPGRFIQLEIGLLYLGMLQAARGGSAGIHALELSGQKRLVDLIEKQLKRSQEALLSPRW
jgi:hypothetical protein